MVPKSILQIAASGIPVFPLAARSKRPLVKWREQASCDTAHLEEWADQWPDCNWGMPTGRASGVWVIDLDGAAGAGWYTDVVARYGDLPDTRTVTTRNGRHLHYAARSSPATMVRNSAGKIAPGVDVRGDGGFVVLPPSIHPDGGRYEWVTSPDQPIVDAPAWLVKFALDANRNQDHVEPNAAGGKGSISKGERNSTLTSMAGAMRNKGFTPEAILAALLAENKERCRPPLDEQEVEGIAKSVGRYQPSARLVSSSHPSNGIQAHQTVTALVSEGDVDYSQSADDLLCEVLSRRQPIITTVDGGTLWYSQSLNQTFAFRGVGKSLHSLARVRIATSGGSWLRYNSSGGFKVLLVDGELPKTVLQERIAEQVGRSGGLLRYISAENLPGHRLPPLSEIDGQKWMLNQIRIIEPDIVIFDTLTACFRFDTNDADAWLRVNPFLIELRAQGLCVDVLHHAGRSGNQRGRTDFDDDMDLIVKLEPPAGWQPGDGADFCVRYEKVRSQDRLHPFRAKLQPSLQPGADWEWMEVPGDEYTVWALHEAGSSCREIEQQTGISKSEISRIIQRIKKHPLALWQARTTPCPGKKVSVPALIYRDRDNGEHQPNQPQGMCPLQDTSLGQVLIPGDPRARRDRTDEWGVL